MLTYINLGMSFLNAIFTKQIGFWMGLAIKDGYLHKIKLQTFQYSLEISLKILYVTLGTGQQLCQSVSSFTIYHMNGRGSSFQSASRYLFLSLSGPDGHQSTRDSHHYQRPPSQLHEVSGGA